jgi:hypothetical protein
VNAADTLRIRARQADQPVLRLADVAAAIEDDPGYGPAYGMRAGPRAALDAMP